MSIWSFVVRLCLLYLALFVGWNITASSVGIGAGNWANTGVVLAAAYVLCTQFGERNRRYFSRQEKVIAVSGFVLFDLLLWTVRSLFAFGAMARAQAGAAFVSYGTIITSTTFILGFHLLAFFAAMVIVERRLQTAGVIGG
jgi:hypothetical protein